MRITIKKSCPSYETLKIMHSYYETRVDTPMGMHFCQFLFLIDRHSQSNLGFYPLHALLYQERFVFTLFIVKFEQIVMASE